LLETVESILQGDETPAEIVIVDQSDQPHPTLASMTQRGSCAIQYLRIDSAGVGRARNASIKAARHDILALIDDDMFVAPDWFGALIRALIAAGPHSIVTGQVRPAEAEVPGGFAPSTKVDEQIAVYQGRIGQDVLFTGNMAMYRSAIDQIGAFDERLGVGARFPAAYDNDFGYRLLEAGYRIIYVPQATVYHRAWRTERDYPRLRWNYGRGRGAYYAKHLSMRDRYMLSRMLADARAHTSQLLQHVRHDRGRIRSDTMYLLGLLSGVTEWLLTQRRAS